MDRELIKGSTRTLLLRLLSERTMYGYELTRELAERSAQVFQLGEGTLYPLLRNLESEGCLSAHWKTVGGRRRRYYAITAKGRRELAARQREWQAFREAVDGVLEGGEA